VRSASGDEKMKVIRILQILIDVLIIARAGVLKNQRREQDLHHGFRRTA